jgi:ubiquinone/menaquinone biosynthesis C-methylase UbiE
MLEMNRYNEFASLYDELMNDFDYEKWFNYIEEIFVKYKISPTKVLEMACGTGNLSIHLAEKGYKLTCFDLSEEMLAQAYEKLNRFKNVKLLNGNMINFKINQKFDSIISICDSINYITDLEDLKRTFENVYNHLDDNGIFIFDINSFYKISEIIGNNIFVEDREDIFYTWQNYYDSETMICEFYLSFFIKENDDNYIRFDEEHKERAYTVDEIISTLKSVGFNSIDCFEAFTLEEINSTTERINFVACK